MFEKILIIDDDEMSRKMTKFVLKDCQYMLLEAETGEMGVQQIIRNEDIKLILLDMEMPGMNGLETYKKIQEVLEGKEMPKIIFLTADGQKDTVLEAGMLGVCDYIVKPFFPQDLLSRVQKVMG